MKKALYILAGLDDRDLIWLRDAGIKRRLAPGETLIAAGREVRELFFVLDGDLTVRLPGGVAVATMAQGDVAGEMSFVEQRLPAAEVVAVTSAEVLAVAREVLLRRFAEDTGFAARFYRALATFLSDRLRRATSGPAADEGDGELDDDLLDNLHVAGDRFIRLVALLDGREQ